MDALRLVSALLHLLEPQAGSWLWPVQMSSIEQSEAVISSQWTSALQPLPPPGDGFDTDRSPQGLCEQNCSLSSG